MKATETTPPPPKPERTFTLELNEQEFYNLKNIFGNLDNADTKRSLK
jgi:hypothetical protein